MCVCLTEAFEAFSAIENLILGDRLTVGQRPLKPLIGVRFPVSQPKNRIAVSAKMQSVAKRRDGGFRQNSPRVFEIQKKRAGREAGVYDEYIIQNEVLRANLEAIIINI